MICSAIPTILHLSLSLGVLCMKHYMGVQHMLRITIFFAFSAAVDVITLGVERDGGCGGGGGESRKSFFSKIGSQFLWPPMWLSKFFPSFSSTEKYKRAISCVAE